MTKKEKEALVRVLKNINYYQDINYQRMEQAIHAPLTLPDIKLKGADQIKDEQIGILQGLSLAYNLIYKMLYLPEQNKKRPTKQARA